MSHIYPTVQELTDSFTSLGIVAMYGGGNQSKGHGFWLYQATPEQAREYHAKHGYCDIPGTVIKNDGKRSGNDCFWMFPDACELEECLTAISICVFPGGISYADRTIETDGDYKRLAFLPFSTLQLKFVSGLVPTHYQKWIEADAAKIQSRVGEQYQVSACGQTITLGKDQ